VAQLRREQGRFEAAGLGVVLVGMGTPAESEAFRRLLDVRFPLVCDPDRSLYELYGLRRGSVGQVASAGVLLRSVRALLQGHLPGMPQGDVLQLAGAFVVDRSGEVRFRHLSRDAADHPKVDDLLGAVARERVS
jgi:hypothetical protein